MANVIEVSHLNAFYARDYDGYSEEDRVKDLVLDDNYFSNPSFLQEEHIETYDVFVALSSNDEINLADKI